MAAVVHMLDDDNQVGRFKLQPSVSPTGRGLPRRNVGYIYCPTEIGRCETNTTIAWRTAGVHMVNKLVSAAHPRNQKCTQSAERSGKRIGRQQTIPQTCLVGKLNTIVNTKKFSSAEDGSFFFPWEFPRLSASVPEVSY